MDDWVWWLIATGVLAAAEAASLTFYLLMLAGGSGLGAAAAALGAPVPAQFAVAAVGALLLLWLVRPVALRHMQPGSGTLTGAEALVGEQAVVLATVTGDGGRVRLNGGEWSARAMDPGQTLEVGQRVQVLRIDGATAVVWQDRYELGAAQQGQESA